MSDLLKALTRDGVTQETIHLLMERLASPQTRCQIQEQRTWYIDSFAKEYGTLYDLPIEEGASGFLLYGCSIPSSCLGFVLSYAKPKSNIVTPEMRAAANRVILWSANAGSGREWVDDALRHLLQLERAARTALWIEPRAALVVRSAIAGLDADGNLQDCPILDAGADLPLLRC